MAIHDLTTDEQPVVEEFRAGTLHWTMIYANKAVGHGQGVEAQISAARFADIHLFGLPALEVNQQAPCNLVRVDSPA